jgi:hypothetical protein
MAEMTMTVVVTTRRITKLRLVIGLLIIRLGAFVAGIGSCVIENEADKT